MVINDVQVENENDFQLEYDNVNAAHGRCWRCGRQCRSERRSFGCPIGEEGQGAGGLELSNRACQSFAISLGFLERIGRKLVYNQNKFTNL